MSAVRVENISKSYPSLKALDSICFTANKGEIFGIIGPDGAGKTTLFRILTTLILPDSGEAWIEGNTILKDYKRIRTKIGYMPGRFSLYQDMTVEENLQFFATLFNTTVERNYDLIKDIYQQIEPFKHRKAGQLSGGMKQKLALSCALIHKPAVLFLDEPTTGVDPVSRKELWGMLAKLRQDGLSVLVSTPYMDEASLCDRIAFIQQGKFLQMDTPQAIIQQYNERLLSVRTKDMYSTLLDLRKHEEVLTSFSFGDSIHITVSPSLKEESLLFYLEQQGHSNISIEVILPSIEDCFMQLTSS